MNMDLPTCGGKMSPLAWIIFWGFIMTIESATDRYFTAAVYEHARLGNDSVDAPQVIIRKNLDYYKRAAAVAQEKGADIIIYPEYGIFSPNERNELKKFLEYVPDPKIVRSNPCEEPNIYSNRTILYELSCIAKLYNIVVVANMGDIQSCAGQTDCPEDGDFHFNTNVAFDRSGTLVGRYHKEHLFFEFGMDLPKQPQDPTFITEFGIFGMFVCFDIVFKKTSDTAKLLEVDAILLSTMWIDPTPLMTSVQLWQSWAMGNNATFLAANIQLPGYLAVGSGIFTAEKGALVYTFNPDGISKLVVATVPKKNHYNVDPNASISLVTNNGSSDWNADGRDVPTVCSRKILGEPTDPYKDYRCMEEDTSNYTLVRLNKSADHIQACNNGMCCSLDYSMNDTSEDYYFGVYNGTYNMYNRYFWCEENCLLVRCDAYNGKPCSTFPMRSNTAFNHVSITANFTTIFIYPSVMKSGMRLVPVKDWTYEFSKEPDVRASIGFHSNQGEPLIVVGLNGRCFDRDTPYVR